jgi:hypothetical protein
MAAKVSTTDLAGYGRLLRRMSEDERLNATHISLFTGSARVLSALSK